MYDLYQPRFRIVWIYANLQAEIIAPAVPIQYRHGYMLNTPFSILFRFIPGLYLYYREGLYGRPGNHAQIGVAE